MFREPFKLCVVKAFLPKLSILIIKQPRIPIAWTGNEIERGVMPGLLPDVDPDGLLEYSVVYTDRAVNHMSGSFQTVMNDISTMLREVYNADSVAVVPGSGTFGMEAVARQFATDEHVLVVEKD